MYLIFDLLFGTKVRKFKLTILNKTRLFILYYECIYFTML